MPVTPKRRSLGFNLQRPPTGYETKGHGPFSTLSTKFLSGIAGAIAVATLALVPGAHAKPPLTNELIRTGVSKQISGKGCSTANVRLRTDANRIVSVTPREGDSLGPDVEVLDVDVRRGYVVWTVGPSPATCTVNDTVYGEGHWKWEPFLTDVWEATYRRHVYSVRASSKDGIRSIAGLRLRPQIRRNRPTVKRAVHAWGRPSGLRRGRGGWKVACQIRWRSIGLQAVFINLGLGHPCRQGYLDSAIIRGRDANRWAVRIGRDPAIVRRASLGYLRASGLGSRGDFDDRTWTLAEVYHRIGTSPGYRPTVSAIFTGRGLLRDDDRIRGFDLWIGAGGD